MSREEDRPTRNSRRLPRSGAAAGAGLVSAVRPAVHPAALGRFRRRVGRLPHDGLRQIRARSGLCRPRRARPAARPRSTDRLLAHEARSAGGDTDGSGGSHDDRCRGRRSPPEGGRVLGLRDAGHRAERAQRRLKADALVVRDDDLPAEPPRAREGSRGQGSRPVPAHSRAAAWVPLAVPRQRSARLVARGGEVRVPRSTDALQRAVHLQDGPDRRRADPTRCHAPCRGGVHRERGFGRPHGIAARLPVRPRQGRTRGSRAAGPLGSRSSSRMRWPAGR